MVVYGIRIHLSKQPFLSYIISINFTPPKKNTSQSSCLNKKWYVSFLCFPGQLFHLFCCWIPLVVSCISWSNLTIKTKTFQTGVGYLKHQLAFPKLEIYYDLITVESLVFFFCLFLDVSTFMRRSCQGPLWHGVVLSRHSLRLLVNGVNSPPPANSISIVVTW